MACLTCARSDIKVVSSGAETSPIGKVEVGSGVAGHTNRVLTAGQADGRTRQAGLTVAIVVIPRVAYAESS